MGSSCEKLTVHRPCVSACPSSFPLTLAWLYPSRQHTPPNCWTQQLKSPASTQASTQRRSLGAGLVKTHGHGLAADHCSSGCQWLNRDTRCFWSGIFRTTRPKTQATTPVWTLSSPDISHSKLESVQRHQQESLSFSVPHTALCLLEWIIPDPHQASRELPT